MQNEQTLPGNWQQGLQIVALFNIAVTRPLMDVVSGAPEFLVSRGNIGGIIVLLVLTLSFFLPGLLALIHYFLRRFSLKAGQIYFGILIGLFLFLISCYGLRRIEALSGSMIFGYGLFSASVVAIGYSKLRAVRMFMSYLSIAIIVVPASFLFTGSIYRLSFAKEPLLPGAHVEAIIPIVVVFLDELPTVSLLDENMEIDRVLFPNFARLANGSTWYRNASAVADTTDFAIPSMLTGKYPGLVTATVMDHPNNLFTFLRNDYEMHVYEPWTALYPKGVRDEVQKHPLASLIRDLSAIYLHQVVPDDYASRLPEVQNIFGDFWGVSQERPVMSRLSYFNAFLQELKADRKNQLFFLHLLLPHAPWEYLPSGKAYDRHDFGVIFPRTWKNDNWEITQMYQSHLVSVSFVDTLLGRLIDRMKSVGLYDDAIFVVSADHGFAPGGGFRSINQVNFADILYVPLFLKLPHQKEGKVVDASVEVVDILPTIADVLGAKVQWQHDGHSVLDDAHSNREKKTIYKKIDYTTESEENRLARKSLEKCEFKHDSDAILSAVKRKIAVFGSHKSVRSVFDFADRNGIIGKNIDEVHQLSRQNVRVTIRNSEEFDAVDLTSAMIPAILTAKLEADRNLPRFELGIALNGKICAVTRSIPDNETQQRFYALLREECFQQGKNQLDVLLLDEIHEVQ